MIIIHVGHKKETRNAELLTDIPGSQGAWLDAGLSIYHDDGSICH